jgi:hypothetical protein
VRVKEGVRAGAPVVMLVLDEFSVETLMNARGGIDPVRFPSFAALAKSATWYRNATTVSNHTTDAVPAVLSGRFPRRGALPIAADHPRSIFTLLGGAYSLRNVDEPSTDLCPERLCGEPSRPAAGVRLERLTKDLTIVSLHRLLPGGLADRLPPVDLTFGDFADQDGDDTATEARGEVNVPTIAFDDRPGQFERFIGGLDGESRTSSFNFLHVLLPHTPWQYLPSGRRYPFSGEAIPGLHNGIWTDDPSPARQAYQRYVLQVGYVDRLVGRLLRRMRAEGLYDRALLVIVADHGISFRPGTSRRSATGKGAADILGVPLFIKVPHQRRGRVDDGHATTADVLPTVADALGIGLDWRLDGRSLLDRDRPAAAVGVATFPARKRLKMPFSDYVRDRDAEVLRTQRRLGDARGWASVYAAGPDSVLFGRRAAELRSGALSDAQVRLDDAEQFAAVRPRGPLVPAFVRGRLSGTAGPGLRLAVAVNGTVRAVTRSYEDGGQTRLGSLVPPAAFRPGANDVQIYEISGQGRSRRLRLIHRQS